MLVFIILKPYHILIKMKYTTLHINVIHNSILQCDTFITRLFLDLF